MNRTDISLSLVIPVYNEEKRIGKTFDALFDFSRHHMFADLEVVFVNDGSRDSTLDKIRNFSASLPVRVISYQENRGKGFAVRRGMLEAKNDYVLFLDADMSTPLSEINLFLPYIRDHEDVIIGSRKIQGARVRKYQPWHRRMMGEVYTALANYITKAGVSDFTCGFKCFSRQASRKVFENAKIDRWSYDAEILFLARKFNLRIIEVGVSWENDEDTKVRLGIDAIQSLFDLVRIPMRK